MGEHVSRGVSEKSVCERERAIAFGTVAPCACHHEDAPQPIVGYPVVLIRRVIDVGETLPYPDIGKDVRTNDAGPIRIGKCAQRAERIGIHWEIAEWRNRDASIGHRILQRLVGCEQMRVWLPQRGRTRRSHGGADRHGGRTDERPPQAHRPRGGVQPHRAGEPEHHVGEVQPGGEQRVGQ